VALVDHLANRVALLAQQLEIMAVCPVAEAVAVPTVVATHKMQDQVVVVQ
jgi:hypothetical protein